MMTDINELLQSAAEVAIQATNFDSKSNSSAAIYLYQQAAFLLKRACEIDGSNDSLLLKADDYTKRAHELIEKEHDKNEATKNEAGKLELAKADFMLREALELDEEEEHEEAIVLYSDAVEVCLKASKDEHLSTEIREKLKQLAVQALSRAEVLKGINNSQGTSGSTVTPNSFKNPVIPPLGIGSLTEQKVSDSATHRVVKGVKGLQLAGRASYSKEELDVLKRTSYINKREYVPFMSMDLKEKFAFPVPFTDKDGLLKLSPKQMRSFGKWCRPEDLSSEPKMIQLIDCFSIKQTCVSDCSFVASLAISALYEKKFKKRLITDIIYPKNKQGDPVYNPCGKYMIKLHVNGIPRKVIVDDLLPVGRYNDLLCSYSTNRNEFWISLVEKAYMKVMGGYDFPGSNSNIDLYALTGWIPERISLQDKDVNKDATFKKVLDRFHKGDVLATVATGEMSDADADRAGLVSTHAYAMLDIREVKGKRMLLLKNPWSHLRWKGRYSELDSTNWTPEMCKLLNYDPKSAQMFDNGVFWIDYESACHFFDVLYMNWNPKIFSHTYCLHQTWTANVGPVRDLYNIGENPQYSLDLKPQSGGGACWILLTRHITDIQDFRDNKEYITLIVYRGGEKVFYPFDPPPYLDGVRINSPHYLCKIVCKSNEAQKYTLIVSQYEKQRTIHYSLRLYSSCPFSLNKIVNLCQHKHEETGKWTGISAGGCPNYRDTYCNNPIYQFRVGEDMRALRVELKAPKEVQIGFEVICIEAKNTSSNTYFSNRKSGNYRSGFCVLEFNNIEEGVYNLIPSTFYPGKEAPYSLCIFSSSAIKVNRIK